MAVTYYDILGGHKRLNEVVVAGSHDAGITKGGGAAKTQDLDIGGQAAAGVRVFDLRIAAVVTKSTMITRSPKEVELMAYHGGITKTKNATVQVAGYHPGTATVTASTAKPGTAFGEGLAKMLADARAFVQSAAGQREFLILKFDKCQNYGIIGEMCRDILGDAIYKGGGNLNNRTLDQLKGKVVTLFPAGGLAEMGAFSAPHGMLAFKNLSGSAAYESRFHGLQYYGKGGTSVVGTERNAAKIAQNIKKQTALMAGAKSLQNPQVVGMIYWTTTGSVWSVKKRNAEMWKRSNVEKFKSLWNNGLSAYMDSAIPTLLPDGSPALGPMRKRFMPNIVMIDFADAAKCSVIRDLNTVPPGDLAALADD